MDDKTAVVRTKNTVVTINKFQYGNGFRVKYTKTDRDPGMTHLLDHADSTFNFPHEADRRFDFLLASAEIEAGLWFIQTQGRSS